MKKILFFAAITVLLTSCQSDENIIPDNRVVGKWELVEAQSSWTREVTPVAEMPFSDSYDLRTNGTFVKFNTHFGKELIGTYEEESYEDADNTDMVKILTLSFDMDVLEELLGESELGNSIYTNYDPSYFHVYGQSGRENLILRSDGSLINSGYAIADGPTYVYHRK